MKLSRIEAVEVAAATAIVHAALRCPSNRAGFYHFSMINVMMWHVIKSPLLIYFRILDCFGYIIPGVKANSESVGNL